MVCNPFALISNHKHLRASTAKHDISKQNNIDFAPVDDVFGLIFSLVDKSLSTIQRTGSIQSGVDDIEITVNKTINNQKNN